jgi:hypothetical protein
MNTLPKRLLSALLITGAMITPASSQSAAPDKSVTCTGLASSEFGQIYRGVYQEAIFEHRWESRGFVDLTLDAHVNDRLSVKTGIEAKISFSHRQGSAFRATEQKFPSVYINQAEGSITVFPETGATPLSVHTGYMPYKYNPDVRNLGEYLFRSMTYPQVLFSEFDYAQTRVMGVRVASELWSKRLRQDLFITTSVDMLPLYDFSIAYVGSIRPAPFIEAGIGIDLDRVISANNAVTNPRISSNSYVDPLDQSDTTWYSFSGTKAMVRFSFDPKPLFSSSMFGPQDLKLYGEACALGIFAGFGSKYAWGNYPGDYEKLWHRVPFMIGLNLPAFRVLDVLAFEAEYYRSPYPNTYYNVMWNQLPRPYMKPDLSPYQKDDWKWSIYASRMLFGGFSIIGQIANDHSRVDVLRDEDAEYEETMRTSAYSPATMFKSGMWYWMLKMKYEF